MRPVRRTSRVSSFLLLSRLVALSLLLSLVPSVPVVAVTPDLVYSYEFTGDDEAPWGPGWTHFTSDTGEYPFLDGDQGVLDGSDVSVVSLRPETVSDAVQQLKLVFDDEEEEGQIWGLVMRSDGSGLWSDSGYYCLLDYYSDEEDAVLYVARVSNGEIVVIDDEDDEVEVPLTTDVWLKCEIEGSDLRAKVWDVGDSEPGGWDLEVTDSTYATGRMGIMQWAERNVEVNIDDYGLEGYESEPVLSPDPGGGDWYTEEFTGDEEDPWPAGWTHLSSDNGEPLPYLLGNAGLLEGEDHQVTSLRPATYTDSEQLLRVIWNPEENRIYGLAARHDGEDEGDQSAYYCFLTYHEDFNDEDPTLAIVEYDEGDEDVLDDVEVDVDTNQWLKCVVEGNQIKAKVWARHEEEPQGWDLEVADNTLASGRSGTLMFGEDEMRIDDYRLGPWPRVSLAVPDLVYSTSDDRSNPDPLDEATVSEDIYVFVSPPEDTVEVEFWVDDPTRSGPAVRTDTTAPFDLVGGTTTADPFDTLTLSEGAHTITAVATLSDTTEEVLQATITVDNIPEVDLVYSTSADRSSPAGLDEAEVSDDIYVFVDPDDPRVSQVDFYINDPTMSASPARSDTSPPWDLVGGDETTADPFDTTLLADGAHTITADFTLTTGADLTITSTFDVENLPDLDVMYSTSANRSSPDPLEAATVDGDVYVFVPDEPDIDGVEFWVDDPLMAGSPVRVDTAAPWDLVGGDVSTADPFDTTTLTEGGHTLTAVVDVDGTPVQLDVAFTVDNLPNTGYTLTGTVFEDAYGNGVVDGGSDSGLFGVDVEVYATDGTTLLGSSSTDSDGEYEIDDLPGGTVIVRVDSATVPHGVILTSPTDQSVYVDGTSDVVNVALAPESLGTSRSYPLAIGTGRVDTHAGDGSDTTVDGPAGSAAFKIMGGITVDEGLLYTATVGSIRVTDTFSGTTRTLAGHATSTGCVDSETPGDVRFGALGAVASDGVYLYTFDPSCGTGAVRKTNISEGSTTTLVDLAGVVDIVVAADGYLYAATTTTIFRVDRHTASVDDVHTATTGITAISADSLYLWFVDGTNLVTFELEEDLVDTVDDLGVPVAAMESTLDHIYMVAGADGSQLVVWDKHNGTLADIAGSATPGYQDGSGVDARLDGSVALASDGIQTLFVADSDNHRIRSVGHDDFHAAGGEAFGNDGYGAWEGDTNAGLGNYVTDHTDFDIATAGPNLGLTRTYNSLDTFAGPFGTGWRFDYEMTWRRDSTGDVVVLYPDGRRETHTPDGLGGYTPPDGYYSTLEADGAGFDLTTKDGTTYTFNGDGELTTITDANTRTLTLAYDDGKLDTVTDTASERSLTFTWTGDRITEVATGTVAAHSGPLTWTYGYDGAGRLVAACDPRTNTVIETFLETAEPGCWRYQYNENHQLTRIIKPEGNTQAIIDYGQQPQANFNFLLFDNPTSAIEADDPVSLWRLDEETGNFADSGSADVTMPSNATNIYEVDGPGSLVAVQTGIIPESVNPQGLSGPVDPAPADLEITGDLTLEGWVRINEGTEFPARIVRLGMQGEWNQEYSLEVSHQGTLRFWSDGTGSPSPVAAITSEAVVFPDVWHHVAVVRSHGTTRYSLYVDGRLVHTEETTPIATASTDTFSLGGGWINDGNYQDTLGAFANLAVFDKALSAERIRAHYSEAIIPTDPEQVWRVTDGENNTTVFDRFQGDRVRIYDGRGNSSYQRFDDMYRLVEEENALEHVTSYTYDPDGNRDSITDGNENTSTLTYDARRNITSQTNGEGETTYMDYDGDDNLTELRDGRSSSSTDDTYLTVYSYDSARNLTSETDALGNERTWEYSDGSETAVGGGTIPSGLLLVEVSPRGNELGADPEDFATSLRIRLRR